MTLLELARILDDWIAPAPGVDGVYLFGSRVRGDHRPDSDVDIRLFVERWGGDDATADWWERVNEIRYADLEARLPGPLHLIRDPDNVVDPLIAAGDEVLRVGRCVCVRTPRKPTS
ncbi:nucleotidyltransferase domain-containing protein [Alsobacter sp. R-9]